MSDLSAIQRAKEQLRADEAAVTAAAEQRGYDRAIANLRMLADDLPADSGRPLLLGAAAHLDSIKAQP